MQSTLSTKLTLLASLAIYLIAPNVMAQSYAPPMPPTRQTEPTQQIQQPQQPQYMGAPQPAGQPQPVQRPSPTSQPNLPSTVQPALPPGYRPPPPPRYYLNDIATQPPGTISTGRYVAGGVVGSLWGLGIGHAINGTWLKTGWIFTALEPAMIVSAIMLSDTDYYRWSFALVGATFITHVFEMVDLWARPNVYNVTELVPTAPPQYMPRASITPWIAPNAAGFSGQLRF